jgi:DNA-binding NarL/FixJ family response regulator
MEACFMRCLQPERNGIMKKGKIKIVIVDDQRILREGLRSLLSIREDFEVVGEAGDGVEAIRCVRELKPQIVLIDLSMPRMNGSAAIREIKRAFPLVKVMALTIHKAEEYILDAFQAGADGYCLKDATQAELIMAVESLYAGNPYVSPGISEKLLRGYLNARTGACDQASAVNLTTREKEILKLIGRGNRNKDISDRLNLSVKTVEKHRSNIMQKLDLHNVSALTAYAIEKGWV